MGTKSKNLAGKILFPTPTEGPFTGIISGGDVAVTLSYDDSKVPSKGPYAYMTNGGADGGVSFAAGEQRLGPNMDNSGSMGWPIIQFLDGKFTGINYCRSFDAYDTKYTFMAQGRYWEIYEKANRRVVASGQIVVPEN